MLAARTIFHVDPGAFLDAPVVYLLERDAGQGFSWSVVGMSAPAAKIIFLLAIIGSAIIRYPHGRRSRWLPVRVSERDLQDTGLVAIAVSGLVILPLTFIATGFPPCADYRFDATLGWVGTLTIVAALSLFYAAHDHLGRNFSPSLEIHREHSLVTSGVYARVRHPMYSALWLLAVGQALLLPNWIAGPAGLLGFGVLFFGRVGREERLMLVTFGSAYNAYMTRTKRVLPWVY
jgi:protein-S-isoprenylcysteine O-methyltransferase Ste14